MRRLPVLLAVLALAGAAPGLALAQTPPPATPAPKGVTVTDVGTWLTSLGGSVAEPETAPGVQILRVADQPLPWSLTFFACETLCDDVQYAAIFTGPITEAQTTAWNREHRYLKAVFHPSETPGGAATVVAQYDLILTSTGTEQLQEPTYSWLQLLRAFDQALRAAVPAPAPPAQ